MISKKFENLSPIKIQTSKYRLHYWESPTGMKLILNTSPEIVPCPGKSYQIKENWL